MTKTSEKELFTPQHQQKIEELVHLAIGVYKDEQGLSVIFPSIKKAEKRLFEKEKNKDYLPIGGDVNYTLLQEKLVMGETPLASFSCQAVGGTGALNVAAAFLYPLFPKSVVALHNPTWVNHANVFTSAGFKTEVVPYYDQTSHSLLIEEYIAALNKLPDRSLVVLQSSCHNPAGADPTPEMWEALLEVIQRKGHFPIFDNAYQGFDQGVDQDGYSHRLFYKRGLEMIVCTSNSKNFGLYNERVGHLTIICQNPDLVDVIGSNVKSIIRSRYSSPSARGAQIAAEVLKDPLLKKEWMEELGKMRERLHSMRKQLVHELTLRGIACDYLLKEKGFFSLLSLSPEKVQLLKEKFAIFLLANGRINMAGLTPDNFSRVADGLGAVLR